MQRQPKWRTLAGVISLAATGSLLSQNALSLQFEAGPVEISLSTKLSLGGSVRMDDANPKYLSGGNKNGGGAGTSVTDDGDLNYDQGDWFSIIFQGTNDLSLNYENFGAFGRIRYWYDAALAENDVNHGNVLSYEKDTPLDDSKFGDLSKAANLVLLDAYIYGSFELGNMPLDVRLGRQVVSWGESTFIQNSVNIINPIDVNALRSPGAELKDALLPVGLLYASLGITNNLNVEAFYQYEWEKFQLPGCGTYFSTADPASDGCDKLTTYSSDQPLSDAELVALGPKKAIYVDGKKKLSLTGNTEFEGGYLRRGADLEPDNGGQYGIAVRYYAEEFNATEFGFYYVNYHERLPIFSVVTGENPQYFFEFPENTEVFALTFATNVDSWSFSGEISHRPKMPLQINTTELVQPLVKPESVWSTMYEEVTKSPNNTIVHGYDDFAVTQFQFTFINFFDRVLGASRLTLLGEVGLDWVDGLPSQNERRYGRSPAFGMGAFGPIDPFGGDNPQLKIDLSSSESVKRIQSLLGISDEKLKEITKENVLIKDEFSCSNVIVRAKIKTLDLGYVPVQKGTPNLNPEYCTNEGYTTELSWGVRFAAALDYNNVFNGVNLRPVLTYFRDMKGYGPTPNFSEGTVVIGYSLSADYLNKYSARIAYTDHKAGKYNPQTDRDFLSISVGVSF